MGIMAPLWGLGTWSTKQGKDPPRVPRPLDRASEQQWQERASLFSLCSMLICIFRHRSGAWREIKNERPRQDPGLRPRGIFFFFFFKGRTCNIQFPGKKEKKRKKEEKKHASHTTHDILKDCFISNKTFKKKKKKKHSPNSHCTSQGTERANGSSRVTQLFYNRLE